MNKKVIGIIITIFLINISLISVSATYNQSNENNEIINIESIRTPRIEKPVRMKLSNTVVAINAQYENIITLAESK